MQNAYQNWPPPYHANGTATEIKYIRRDLDKLDTRVTALEKGPSRKRLSDQVDWKIIGLVFLFALGMTGHLTFGEIKRFLLGLSL
jgi:hypothetical protein